jgi:hypothetical protein
MIAKGQLVGAAMQELQKIEIDWDIHKMIEGERRSFDEPPYVALRRLLKLPESKDARAPAAPAVAGGVPWTESGVTVPHGSLARMEYGRGSQIYEGQFLNGMLVVEGQSFDSLSAAANALAVTKEGKKPSLNGWLYWKVRFPGEMKWRSLNDMRRR